MYRNRFNTFLCSAVKLYRTSFATKYLYSSTQQGSSQITKVPCISSSIKRYSTISDDKENLKSKAGSEKYRIFSDYDSPVILDVDEERQLRLEHPELFEQSEDKEDEFKDYNLERGETGVFEIEELVDILRKENAIDLCVVQVPAEYNYVDYMVIVSGRSLKHLNAMAEFIKKLYKRKKSEHDYFPIIEGKKSNDWMAIDLGNIALHFQTKEARKKFDIEMLWSLGPEYDDQINAKENEYITLLNQHTEISDLEPIDFSAVKNR